MKWGADRSSACSGLFGRGIWSETRACSRHRCADDALGRSGTFSPRIEFCVVLRVLRLFGLLKI